MSPVVVAVVRLYLAYGSVVSCSCSQGVYFCVASLQVTQIHLSVRDVP